jgi:hypothetical protein
VAENGSESNHEKLLAKPGSGYGKRRQPTARMSRRLVHVLAAFSLAAQAAGADTFTVTTEDDVVADDAFTSLREAILGSNANAGPDTILLPAGAYVLSLAGASEDASLTGDLDVHDSVTLQGAGADQTVIDAAQLDRVMFVSAVVTAVIEDVTLTGGAAFVGAGLYNEGQLTVRRCRIVDNEALVYGAGIEQWSGLLVLESSLVANNVAGDTGGGGLDLVDGVVVVRNSTIAGNESRAGAGIFVDQGVVALLQSTVASNRATVLGGGVYLYGPGGVGDVVNTVVAQNQAPQHPDMQAVVVTLGYNLVGDAAGAQGFGPLDLVGADARLGALRDNGGPTPTHALRAGSPAINAGDPATNTNSAPYDQRGPGYPRQRGLRVDIGAFEYEFPDHDGDGMADEWEIQYGFDPTNSLDGAADQDGDGVSNAGEFMADTVPTNGASFFALADIEEISEERWISFPTVTSRVYQLEGATGLHASDWLPLGDSVPGASGVLQVYDDELFDSRAYRVRVRLPGE